MTLDQLEKFSGKDYDGKLTFIRKPFAIDKWRVATDGYTLVAENGFSQIKLPELEASNNRDYVLRKLEVKIPQTLYSSDHLKGYLGDEDSEFSEPMMFNGHRIDKAKLLRKVFALCDEPYRFTVNEGTFHFAFGKTIVLIMGMIQPQSNDPRYEPKLIKNVSR